MKQEGGRDGETKERMGQVGQEGKEGGGELLRRSKTAVARRKCGQEEPSEIALGNVSGRD